MSIKAGIVDGRLYGLTCAYCADDNKPGDRDVFNDSRKLRDHTKLAHGAQKPKRGPLALANAVWLCYSCRRVFFNEQGIATHQGRNPKCKGTPRAQLPNENLANVHFDVSEPDEIEIPKASATVDEDTAKRDPSPRKRKATGEQKVHFVGDFKSVQVVPSEVTVVPLPSAPLAVPHKDVDASQLPTVVGSYPWPRVADPPKKKRKSGAVPASEPTQTASTSLKLSHATNESNGSSDYGSGLVSATIEKLRAKMFEITRDAVKADRWTRRIVLDELDQTIPE